MHICDSRPAKLNYKESKASFYGMIFQCLVDRLGAWHKKHRYELIVTFKIFCSNVYLGIWRELWSREKGFKIFRSFWGAWKKSLFTIQISSYQLPHDFLSFDSSNNKDLRDQEWFSWNNWNTHLRNLSNVYCCHQSIYFSLKSQRLVFFIDLFFC